MGRGALQKVGQIIALVFSLTCCVHSRQLAPTDYVSIKEDVNSAAHSAERNGINGLGPLNQRDIDGYLVRLTGDATAGERARDVGRDAKGDNVGDAHNQQQQRQPQPQPQQQQEQQVFSTPLLVPPEYIHYVDVGVPASLLSEQELLWIHDKMVDLLNLPSSHVLISPAWSWGDYVGMVLVRPDVDVTDHLLDYTDLLPDSHLARHIRAASASFLPLPHLRSNQQDGIWLAVESDSLSSSSSSSWWTRDALLSWLPYVMAAVAALLMLGGAALVIWCCLRRRRQHAGEKSDAPGGLDEVKSLPPAATLHPQQICYPSAKPDVYNATLIQPSLSSLVGAAPRTPVHGGSMSPPMTGYSSPATYSSSSSTPMSTPVHTPPPRHRRHHRGLLERRGSNASLTIDLNLEKAAQEPKWGSPPKESSAEEYLMSASHRMNRKELRNCLKNVRALYEEFWEIPMNHPDKVEVAGSGMKNRYRTIIPNEATRVKLPEVDGDPLTSYINANYIRGYSAEPRAYIAMQGPMSNTVVDFWRMIWQEKAPIVVMITKLKEKNRTKCESYLPERYGAYGHLEVFVHSISEKDGFILRKITMKCGEEEHSLVHYWYTAWPDHKAPNTARQLLDLVNTVHAHKYSIPGPIVVHCSAGIGRTGCFIGTSIGVHMLAKENRVDIQSIVCTMRLDRGGMVQTNEQYEFVHQALSLYEREQATEESSADTGTTPTAAETAAATAGDITATAATITELSASSPVVSFD